MDHTISTTETIVHKGRTIYKKEAVLRLPGRPVTERIYYEIADEDAIALDIDFPMYTKLNDAKRIIDIYSEPESNRPEESAKIGAEVRRSWLAKTWTWISKPRGKAAREARLQERALDVIEESFREDLAE